MKKSVKLQITVLALAVTVLSGTSVFADGSGSDLSSALNGSNSVSSTQHFRALAGIPADSMRETELDEVQGKFTPNPDCDSGCYFPIPPFPPYEVLLLDHKIVYGLKRPSLKAGPDPTPWRAAKIEPDPVPWKVNPEPQPWKDLSHQVIRNVSK